MSSETLEVTMRAKVITALVLVALGFVVLLWPHTYSYNSDGSNPVACGSALAQSSDGQAQTTGCYDAILLPRVGGWGLVILGGLLLFAPVRPSRRPRAPLPFLESRAD